MLARLLSALWRTGRPDGTNATRSARSFVAFVTQIAAPHFLQPGENFDSDQASMRLRVGIPARELARRVPICLVPLEYLERDPSLRGLGRASAVVLGKVPVRFVTQNAARAMALVRWAESAARERRVIADFSDDYAAAAQTYGAPVLAEFQRHLLAACHASVPTAALKQQLAPFARHGITVVEDPYESAHAGEPRFAPGAVLRLVWFGVFGPELRPFVQEELTHIARGVQMPIELAFVTYASQASLVADMASALRHAHAAFHVRHVPWSLDAAARELAHADLAVLPQDAASPWGRVKSHNRLVEALRAGRLAVASPIPSYLELASYAWVGSELAAGINWALAHPEEAVRRIRAGQAYVEIRFAPSRVADAWASALGIPSAG